MLPRSCLQAGSRTDSTTFLSDDCWFLIENFFPNQPVSAKGGRPERNNRQCFEGILWVLTTGARWKDLPSHYPSYTTCWRRFKHWTESGAFLLAWTSILELCRQIDGLDTTTLLGDATFCPAKKGA
ncbi:transposase [Rubinisphaera margarita]|uniref:transposase n=1 Tax=Rubinisphaera margarita TaxID=2909586 RepID=UPI001EE78C49|nr:transposase [Rubinisphaera margarita]MCG6154177.1 transposase [Rubinisphaera margarita]